ncbi:hypothetical protein SASC598J21_000870, partial [Snodgrassella alvi SCGC AB-598-J21]
VGEIPSNLVTLSGLKLGPHMINSIVTSVCNILLSYK